MAHEIKIEEVENGLKITDTLDGNVVIKYLTTYALPFIRSTNEAGLTFQVVDTVGEIYNLPAEPDEFILYDITGTMYLSSDGTELIENSLNLKPFRRENPYDKVLSLGVVTATEDTVNLPLPVSGINSVRIDGNIYSRSIPQTFAFTEVTTGQKILIIQAKPDSTVFYLVEGAEATEAVEPTFTGLFVARIIVDVDGYVVEYPILDYIPLNGTEEDKPVTGDIELDLSNYNSVNIFANETINNDVYKITFDGDTPNFEIGRYKNSTTIKSVIRFNNGSIELIGDGLTSSAGIALGGDGGDILIKSSALGIVGFEEFNKQGNRKAFAQLSDLQDGFIPLTGTEEGKPVTGPIEIVDDFINLVNGLVNLDRDRNIIAGVGVLANIPRLYRKTEDGYDAVDLNSNGLTSNNYHGENYIENSYTQKKYVDKQHSYSTDEIKTGGKWIDDKDIFTITQLTADTPPTMETVFPTEVIGLYTVYKYTKP